MTSILVFVASFPVSGYVAKLLRHLVSPTTWWTKGDRYLQAVKDGTVFLGLSALLVFFLALWVILRERFTTNLPSIGSIRLPLFAVGLLLTVYTVIHLALMGGIGATDEKQVMGFLLTRAIGRDIIYSDMRTIATLSILYRLHNHTGTFRSLGTMTDQDLNHFLHNATAGYLVINEPRIDYFHATDRPALRLLNKWLLEGFPSAWEVVAHFPSSKYRGKQVLIVKIP